MILAFGSINVDFLLPAPHLPQPGETVLTDHYVVMPGGKGANQAVAAARAGAQVAFFGAVGQDAWGDRMRANLAGHGIATTGVASVDANTGLAAVMVDATGENAIVVASGANSMLRADQVPDSALTPRTLVLLQMEVPAAENWRLVTRARQRGARTVLNAAPAAPIPADALQALDLLIVNRTEGAAIAAALGLAAADPPDLVRALSRHARLHCVLTLGGEGALAAAPDGVWRVPPVPVEAVDTTGAGDAFCGVLAAALDAGATLPDALRRASVGGALACQKLGAQDSLPRAAEIEAWLPRAPVPVSL